MSRTFLREAAALLDELVLSDDFAELDAGCVRAPAVTTGTPRARAVPGAQGNLLDGACRSVDSLAAMTPWTLVERAPSSDGTQLELMRRGPHFSIRVNGRLLMNSRVHDSEEALAELALGALPARERAHVLIGGLGFGYTLAATLARVGLEGRVTVIEIAPAVIEWNRRHLAELNGRALDDARVQVVTGDVCDAVRTPSSPYDVILLDVDNGPRAVGRPSNAWLYTPAGLAAMRAALAPGGVLAIWSAGPEVGFSDRLRAADFVVTLQRVQSHAARTQERHFIWLAQRTDS